MHNTLYMDMDSNGSEYEPPIQLYAMPYAILMLCIKTYWEEALPTGIYCYNAKVVLGTSDASTGTITNEPNDHFSP